jgi:glycosyltransferase involved in cell wall biosynthesis
MTAPVAGAGPETAEERLPGVFLMMDSLETGGSERQFAVLARSLDPASFRLHLGCLQKRGAFLDGLGEVPEFSLGGNLYGLQSWRTRFQLARHLRRHRINIAHSFDFYTNLTLIPTARMAGLPVVIGSQRQLGDLLTPMQFNTQAAVFRWCDRVVCNSRAAADRLAQAGLPERKVVVIGNGLPVSAFAQTAPALQPAPGLLRVGIVARMNHAGKKHALLLRAASHLRGQFSQLEFVLAGDGPLRPELELEAKNLGLSDQVRFLGDRRDIPAVLASLDVSVLPSSSESLSNAILESMAAGVPVVASRVGGNPELVAEDRGILVTPDDEEALAKALGRLLRDPALRAALGRNGRQFAQANFTVEEMRRRHEALYAELLAEKCRRPKADRRELPKEVTDRCGQP